MELEAAQLFAGNLTIVVHVRLVEPIVSSGGKFLGAHLAVPIYIETTVTTRQILFAPLLDQRF